MSLALVTAAIESPTAGAISALLDSEHAVFWVDWREYDENIPDACELVLQTGHLSGEHIEVSAPPGHEVAVRFRERRVVVPLGAHGEGSADRHLTLLALNDAMRPEFEARFCLDSDGSDTLAFLPLPCETWAELEARHGTAVAARFRVLSERPNVFTDPPAPTAANSPADAGVVGRARRFLDRLF